MKKSSKNSSCLKKANQAGCEHLFPTGWQLWQPLWLQTYWDNHPLPTQQKLVDVMSVCICPCYCYPFSNSFTVSFLAAAQEQAAAAPRPSVVQAPLLALVKREMVPAASSMLQTYRHDLLQPEELSDLMLVLWTETKFCLWKRKIWFPKDRDFEHFCCLNFVKLS